MRMLQIGWAVLGLGSLGLGAADPWVAFEGPVGEVAPELSAWVRPGDILAGSLVRRELSPQDQWPEDAARTRLEDFLESGELTVDRNRVALWSARKRDRTEFLEMHRSGDRATQPDLLHLAVPVQGEALGDDQWSPTWLEIWLTDRRGTLVRDGALPEEFPWESSAFRLTAVSDKTGAQAFVAGTLSYFGPYDQSRRPEEEIALLESIVLELNRTIETQRREMEILRQQLESARGRHQVLEQQIATLQAQLEAARSQPEFDRLAEALAAAEAQRAALEEEAGEWQSAAGNWRRQAESAAAEVRGWQVRFEQAQARNDRFDWLAQRLSAELEEVVRLKETLQREAAAAGSALPPAAPPAAAPTDRWDGLPPSAEPPTAAPDSLRRVLRPLRPAPPVRTEPVRRGPRGK